MKDLVLYYRPTCPYCQKVLAFMQSKDLSLAMKDIGSDADAMTELLTTGGKKQVPCLFIDGQAMYESDDIIAWLENNALEN